MKIEAKTPDEYINKLPWDRKEAIGKLRNIIRRNLPVGFEETMSYGMIGYVVPKSIYPQGYHVNTELPLPFINIASQKNHIALYHNGIYADKNLLRWFENEYSKSEKTRPDMGKSCLRFKKTQHIPYELIERLVQRMSVQEWINLYESNIKR